MALPFVPVTDSEQAYGMLVRGEIQAICLASTDLGARRRR